MLTKMNEALITSCCLYVYATGNVSPYDGGNCSDTHLHRQYTPTPEHGIDDDDGDDDYDDVDNVYVL